MPALSCSVSYRLYYPREQLRQKSIGLAHFGCAINISQYWSFSVPFTNYLGMYVGTIGLLRYRMSNGRISLSRRGAAVRVHCHVYRPPADDELADAGDRSHNWRQLCRHTQLHGQNKRRHGLSILSICGKVSRHLGISFRRLDRISWSKPNNEACPQPHLYDSSPASLGPLTDKKEQNITFSDSCYTIQCPLGTDNYQYQPKISDRC